MGKALLEVSRDGHKMRHWRKANPERDRANARAWYAKNREKVLERSKKYSKNNRKTIMGRTRLRRYGITAQEFDKMRLEQQNRCAICEAVFSEIIGPHDVALDHDHNTGKVRKLLCRRCNTGIGLMKDSAALLEKAVKYLRSFEPLESLRG